jgi:molecular chaperone DnaK
MERPLYLGIDLGTTNSAACVFDGEQLQSVRSAAGETLTPSVVRIDARGNLTVGTRAFRFLQKDPDNTRGEFKRLMGSKNRYRFAAANLERSPEELAAQVLISLQKDVEAQLGVRPERAVVAVPALFELPQIKATSEAARLAGFQRIETIQEPVASALASGWSADECRGSWLVYDLGGGTFDVSLLETQEGLLRIAGHDGDNFLGGRDFDLAVVDWLIARVFESSGVRILRSDPTHASAIAQLKVAAEEAKIELSRAAQETTIVLEGLRVGEHEIELIEQPLSRSELETITLPLIERSVRVCERLLRAQGVQQLERIVLVGGPTMMPALRARLEQAFNAPFGSGLDPMLLVAQGAALFAATAGLDARSPAGSGQAATGPRVWLQYPAMTPDTSPFIVGRATDPADGVKSVRLSRADGEWQSEWLELDDERSFAGMIALKRRAASTFRVEVLLLDGRTSSANPASISVVHGVSIGEPPLARTIGVAQANNGVAVYFERGSPLPIRKTFTHRTVENISPTAEYALRVPIVQGDFPFAHLCRLVGVIEIGAASLKSPLPAGSVIELTLEVDRGGALSAKALLPAQDLVFERVEQLLAPAISPEKMGALVTELEQRAANLRGKAFREGARSAIVTLADFEATLAAVRTDLDAARGGDQDAAEKARRALIECDGLLGDIEAASAWPELSARIYEEHTVASDWVSNFGTEQEKRGLAQAMDLAERALRARSTGEIERQLRAITRIKLMAYYRDPNSWSRSLDHAASEVQGSTDPVKAQALVRQGRKAEQAGNRKELERIVRELWHLYPVDHEERGLSFNSGVR